MLLCRFIAALRKNYEALGTGRNEAPGTHSIRSILRGSLKAPSLANLKGIFKTRG